MNRDCGRAKSPVGGPIVIRPDPAPGGSEVEVEYHGGRPVYYRPVGGGDWKRVPIDPKTGKGKVRVPRGPGLLLVSDRRDPPQSADVLIVDPGS